MREKGAEKIKDAKRLKWGETPWDDLSKEDLLFLVWRYHSALSGLASMAKISRHGNEDSPYWTPGGMGFKYLSRADSLMHDAGDDTDEGSERIYRNFFRYATKFLFPNLALPYDNWHVCEKCGGMTASIQQPPTKVCNCKGEWRPIELSDIRPKSKGGER